MAETTTTDTAAVSGARRGAEMVFAYLAVLLVLGIVVQFFLAGLGTFGIDGRDLEDATSLDAHRALGFILAGVGLLMLIAAIVARTSKFAIWGSLVVVLLIEPVQTALAASGDDHHWVGGLHALNGVIILALAAALHITSRGRLGGRH